VGEAVLVRPGGDRQRYVEVMSNLFDDPALGAPEPSRQAPVFDGPRCPRCGTDDPDRRFYGPCANCRDALGVTMRLAPREIAVEAYVPKMNVVANHVATKE
jgi:hypothetical protein